MIENKAQTRQADLVLRELKPPPRVTSHKSKALSTTYHCRFHYHSGDYGEVLQFQIDGIAWKKRDERYVDMRDIICLR